MNIFTSKFKQIMYGITNISSHLITLAFIFLLIVYMVAYNSLTTVHPIMVNPSSTKYLIFAVICMLVSRIMRFYKNHIDANANSVLKKYHIQVIK